VFLSRDLSRGAHVIELSYFPRRTKTIPGDKIQHNFSYLCDARRFYRLEFMIGISLDESVECPAERPSDFSISLEFH